MDKRSRSNLSSPSGSLINMFDGSTKQVQDVEVGDVVKSYLPVGLPDEFYTYDWLSYTTTDLSGSVAVRFSCYENIWIKTIMDII